MQLLRRRVMLKLAAGAVLAVQPMIVFFLIFQRYCIEGMQMGAVKE